MADYGLILKNSGNGIQIDSTYKNFTLHDSGTHVSTSGPVEFKYQIDFDDTDDTPILAYRPISTYYLARGINHISGSTFTAAQLLATDEISVSIPWIVFTETPLNVLPTYGLIVKNSSDEVVFSSNEVYFKIKSVTSLSFILNSSQDIGSLDVDNNYYFLTHNQRWVGGAYYPGIVRLSSSSIRAKMFRLTDQSSPGDSVNSYTGFLIEVGI